MSTQPLHSNHHFGKACLTEADAYLLARHLVPWTDTPFWGSAARLILVALILKLQEEKGSDWGKTDLIALASEPKKNVLRDVKRYLPFAAGLLRKRKTPGEQVLTTLLIALGRDDLPLEAHTPPSLPILGETLTPPGASS